MKIGIDKIGFYVPPFALNMNELAVARGVDPAKYTIGIGQDQMAVTPITQDIVSMGANAAQAIITQEDKETIDMILVGSETGIDYSKSAGVAIARLLGLSKSVRSSEIKHACYGATAALQLARGHIALNPDAKVLVIATDISKYGLKSGGEPTQGAGAVAMVVSANPRVLVIDNATAFYTDDVYDFWRPNYADFPFVDGKYSNEQYIRFFNEVWNDYQAKTGLSLHDFKALCFHLPYSKMGMKAFAPILEQEDEQTQHYYRARYQESIQYNRQIGNVYTASLFISLISLLENSTALVAGDKIGLYSYGSGAVAEFFAAELVVGFEKHLYATYHQQLLKNRQSLTVEAYESMFQDTIRTDQLMQEFSYQTDDSPFRLQRVENHVRYYESQIN